MVSGYHDLTKSLAIVGNVIWQQWNQFGKRSPTINLVNYQDTWGFALGTRYRIDEKWLWMLGATYDTSPISSAKQRPPALWLDRQIRVGTGVQYAFNERATIGAAYAYHNMGKANINRQKPLAGTLQGKYSTDDIHWFNVTLNWNF